MIEMILYSALYATLLFPLLYRLAIKSTYDEGVRALLATYKKDIFKPPKKARARAQEVRRVAWSVISRANIAPISTLYKQHLFCKELLGLPANIFCAVSYKRRRIVCIVDVCQDQHEGIDPLFSLEGTEGLIAHEVAHHRPFLWHGYLCANVLFVWFCLFFAFFMAHMAHPAGAWVILAGTILLCFFSMCMLNVYRRYIEYRADKHALALTNHPKAFIRAMQELETFERGHKRALLEKLMASHPPTRKRIRRLCKQYKKMRLNTA